MRKKSKLGYILRVTEHKDLKDKHLGIRERKVERRTFTHRVKVVVRDEETRRVIKSYMAKIKEYRKTYHEGDQNRFSSSFVTRNSEELEAVLTKKQKQFFKSKNTDFSATGQIFQGRVKNRYESRLRYGDKVSKAARLYSFQHKSSRTKLRNATVEFLGDLRELNIYYTLKKYKRKKGTKVQQSILPVTKRIPPRRSPAFKLTEAEEKRQARKAYKVRKPTVTGKKIVAALRRKHK